MTQPAALLLSILVEMPLAYAVTRALRWGRADRAGLAAAAGTALTHWPAWFLVTAGEPALGYWPAVLLTECAVVLAEAVAFRALVPLPPTRALAVSLAANAASTGFGLLLYALDLA